MTTVNRETRRKLAKAPAASSPEDFKKKAKVYVTLPSGLRCRVRRPGMTKFLEAGFLPAPLAAVITEQINGNNKADPQKALRDVAKDPAMLTDLMRAMDRIAAHCILEPRVEWHERIVEPGVNPTHEEIPEEDRDEDYVYTDEIDFEDKQFVFQFAVGGSTDLTQFREELNSAVAAIQAGGEVVEAPE